jgi:hypothetical protein
MARLLRLAAWLAVGLAAVVLMEGTADAENATVVQRAIPTWENSRRERQGSRMS